jgi:hypothetical protein
MLEAINEPPMAHHGRDFPAKKYSCSFRFRFLTEIQIPILANMTKYPIKTMKSSLAKSIISNYPQGDVWLPI